MQTITTHSAAQELTKLRVATMRGFTGNASPLERTRAAALYAREDVELLEWAKRAVRAFQSMLSGPREPEEGATDEMEKGDKGDFQRRRTEPGWAAAARALEERVASGGGRGRARRFPAVVVGSLLDNVPNVAGLARSCEIFGVAQLCIRNVLFPRPYSVSDFVFCSEQEGAYRGCLPADECKRRAPLAHGRGEG